MAHSPKTSLKQTNIPWIGEIPEDWKVKKLKFVFKYVTGGTPDSGKGSYYDENGYNWITISDMNGRYTGESKNKISALAIKEKNMRIVPKGSLLYSFKLSVGQLAFVSEDTYTNEAILAILPKEGLNLDFWYYALESYFDSNANENIYGAKIFNQFSIDNGLIISPTISTQSAIAHFLDAKIEKISTLISKKKQLIELLREQKQSIIHQAVTKGIDKNAKMKNSGIPWIGEIPEDWEVKKLKYVCRNLNTRRIPLSGDERGQMIDKNYDYYGASGIIDQVDNYIFDGEYILIGEDGANILSRSSRMSFIAKGKFWVNNHAHILEPIRDDIYFLNEQLETVDYSIFASGSAQPKLTQENLMSILVAIPTPQEQNKIIEYIKLETTQIDTAITKIEQEITLIQEYRTSLIYQAVTGKIHIS